MLSNSRGGNEQIVGLKCYTPWQVGNHKFARKKHT